jgi:energy-coupling factor transporter ATP-binding protein EcfA2
MRPPLIDIGGISVTKSDIKAAIAILKSANGTAVKQPLANNNSPLASMDYHAVASKFRADHPEAEATKGNKRQPVAHVKAAVEGYLTEVLRQVGEAVMTLPPPPLSAERADGGRANLEERDSVIGDRGEVANSDDAVEDSEYRGFRILLDDPAKKPGLRFNDYASALADTVRSSKPEFAIGIFGSWGSGKTTLMRAIEKILARDSSVVTVWFTAWRYEKDPHLIVPLLDVLREALQERADEQHSWARIASDAVGRAGSAFLAGVTLSAGLAGVQAQLEPGKIIDAIRSRDDNGTQSLSYYHAGFDMLRDAIINLSNCGQRRLVIFIDDLDRCLPAEALAVLESMKLFFDVEGCIFVVGLDQAITELAVAVKYRSLSEPGDEAKLSSADYIRKIFQLQFAVPPVRTTELREFLDTVVTNGSLSQAQIADIQQNVRQHLAFLTDDDILNMREIKRLINGYSLQLKILSSRLRHELNPNIVLGLQCMSFRADWREFYDELTADPRAFEAMLRGAISEEGGPEPAVWLSRKLILPPRLVEYLQSVARPLLYAADLEPYLSVAESIRVTDPSVLEARIALGRLRQATEELSAGGSERAEVVTKIMSYLRNLMANVSRISLGTRSGLSQTLSQLDGLSNDLKRPDITEEFASDWIRRATQRYDELDSTLRTLSRQTSTGGYE